MEEQTKIGTGAAAGIALMSLLEPHIFESSPLVAVLVYSALAAVVIWGFYPAVMRGVRGVRTAKMGMTLVYVGFGIMAVGAVIGTIGALNADGFIGLNWLEHKRPGPLAGLTNAQLRERTIGAAHGLRHLEQDHKNRRQQLEYQGFARRQSMQSNTEKVDSFHNDTAQGMALMNEMEGIFRDKFRSEVILLRDEFRARLKPLPMPEGRLPNGMMVRPDMAIFDQPFLVGPDPLSGGADLLEYWANQLP